MWTELCHWLIASLDCRSSSYFAFPRAFDAQAPFSRCLRPRDCLAGLVSKICAFSPRFSLAVCERGSPAAVLRRRLHSFATGARVVGRERCDRAKSLASGPALDSNESDARFVRRPIDGTAALRPVLGGCFEKWLWQLLYPTDSTSHLMAAAISPTRVAGANLTLLACSSSSENCSCDGPPSADFPQVTALAGNPNQSSVCFA